MELCHNCNCTFTEPHWHNFEEDPNDGSNFIETTHWVGKSAYELFKRNEMEFTNYVRKPFVVEAIEVTVENINEVAKYVGEVKQKDDGTPFIYVDRRLVPNVFRVFPGFFMTRMGDHIRCYSRKVFMEQFRIADENIMSWVEWVNASDSEEVPTTPAP